MPRCGLAVVLCPADCTVDADEDGTDDVSVNPIGGSRMASASGTLYNNVAIGVDDQGFWGSNAGVATCFWNPEGDNICDEDDFGSPTQCGGVALLGSPFASDEVTIWIHTLVVDSDLDVCGGTFGTMSATFF